MALLWTDGTWTTESAVSGYSYEAPIPGVVTQYIRRQDFIVAAANYSPPAISTQDGSTGYYFIGDTGMHDLGGGMVRFTREWAKIPAQHTEWETYAYNFIGFYGAYGINVTTIAGRERFTPPSVPCQVVHDYYLCTSGQPYTTPGAIQVNAGQRYLIHGTNLTTDWLSDSPPFSTASDPTRTAYEAMIADAVANKWSATTGKIVVADSTLDRWRGEIFVRKTKYILAQ